ncbi:MAG TPA: D-alanyl-D-alanine carboxypeptidase/D-alanyl-D-alanine-endopeptidase [Casimicrobiaceae bacterium]|nr:D-alanyl-D-alanine carboxypeptidase/D-alanyl-D-alanine-endopeptidase [Casimicrobiaceae bacterium]
MNARFRTGMGRLLWAAAFCAIASVANADLPRGVGRAFLDAGIPLNRVALYVQDVDKLQPLFAYDADRPMNPASTMKLVTTLAALELLGPDYRWRTEAYLDGRLRNGALDGDLILKGYGDPKITVEQWQAFMNTLVSQGLLTIKGDLVLDRSAFALPPHDPGAFDGEPLKPYNVGPDALLVSFKSVDVSFAPDFSSNVARIKVDPPLAALSVPATLPLRSGDCGDFRLAIAPSYNDDGRSAHVAFHGGYPASCGERDWWIALLDHPAYVHSMFTAYFNAAGGRFDGALKEARAPRSAKPFAVLESPPLYDIVRDVNKLSNNVMARQIFLTLALAKSAAPATPDKAAGVVRAWLKQQKLVLPGLNMENGSGLSRHERISARGLARLLLAADHSPVRDEFASSLAVAAMDGTVQRRFVDGTVAGQALLKTGSLEGVRALAGYVIGAGGRRFVVVAIINHPNAARGAPALDYLVQWVYQNAATWDRGQQH